MDRVCPIERDDAAHSRPAMQSTTVLETSPCAPLAQLLSRVAADPDQTDQLHTLLSRYCHDSRNILNGMKMSIYLAKRREGAEGIVGDIWRELEPRYLEVERLFERLHQLCRPSPLNPVRLPLDLLFNERGGPWRQTLEAVGGVLRLDPPTQPAVGAFDPFRLAPALDDLIAWRARIGSPGSSLSVDWRTRDARFEVRFTEVPPPRTSSRPEPEQAPSELDPDPSDVFCIPILTRVVTQHRGELSHANRPGGLWCLSMSWPTEFCVEP